MYCLHFNGIKITEIKPKAFIELIQYGVCVESVSKIIDFVYSFEPGGRLNKKDGLTRYGNSHVKDKTS